MKFISTSMGECRVSFKEALMNGLAPDGGLYLPEYIPLLGKDFINNLSNYSFHEIAFQVSRLFLSDEIEDAKLKNLIEECFDFKVPLIQLNEKYFILELFHGPTLAFKDFGARFMARLLKHFTEQDNGGLNILVATSGDTGSAVANGFWGIEGINVVILYPKNGVSTIQEQQLTTLGGNITALEIEGTFDDCQRLVKSAFNDSALRKQKKLTSANSINIGRLLPQSFYYLEAYKQFTNQDKVVFTVPSGNLGNLTGGLLAKRMGVPIEGFIAATNANRMFTDYIKTNKVSVRKSVKTISNAMDVGNPSNLDRILTLFKSNYDDVKSVIDSSSYSDVQTINMIKEVYNNFNYILDPHGAVGMLAANNYSNKMENENIRNVVLETAHPAKFKDVVETSVKCEIEIPERLKDCLSKEKQSLQISKDYCDFKDYLYQIKN